MEHSLDGGAYSIHMHHTQSSGGTSEAMGYLTYTGNKYLIVDNIIACTEEADAGMTAFLVSANPTTLSGGASVTANNLNLTSSKVLDATAVHNNDGTAVTASGGTHLFCTRVSGPSTQVIEFNDALILGKNDTIAIFATAATTATKTRATIFLLEDSD
jgi:hypothetical protein